MRILATRRKQLMKYLAIRGVDTLIHYPTPIHKQQSFAAYHHILLRKTEQYVREIVSLPVHPLMPGDQIKTVARLIRAFYRQKG